MFSVASQHPIMQWDTLIKTYFKKTIGKSETIPKHNTIHETERKHCLCSEVLVELYIKPKVTITEYI